MGCQISLALSSAIHENIFKTVYKNILYILPEICQNFHCFLAEIINLRQSGNTKKYSSAHGCRICRYIL